MSLFRGIRYFLLQEHSKQKTLKEILGFYPKNFSLYDQAFTHRSMLQQEDGIERVSNERLEFLGDAILGSIVAEYVFKRYPYKDEGFLTKLRSKLVSRNFLNKLSVSIGLDTFIETSANTARSKSIYGDAFEALIGAIYLDHGYSKCKDFVINKIIRDYIDVDEVASTESNFKSRLIEFAQKKKLSYTFNTVELENKEQRYFSCDLNVHSYETVKGEGNSKKNAEQQASKLFFVEKQKRSS